MYALRACIVDTARRNTLGAIGRATQQLGAMVPTGEENVRWTIISLTIVGVGVVVSPFSGGTSLGAGLSAAGVAGSYLDNVNPDQKYAKDIGGIVEGMWRELKKASDELEYSEWELYQKISKHERSILSTDSQWIELPDLSRIPDSGGKSKPGFAVEIEHIENLAKNCFEASEVYESAIKELVSADVADEQLRGAGFQRTPGDAKVIETRDALHSFLRTTCARYYEAGERLKETAGEYYKSEQEKVEALKKLGSEIPDFNGERPGQGGTVDQNLGATDRGALAPDFPKTQAKENDKDEGSSIFDRLFPGD